MMLTPRDFFVCMMKNQESKLARVFTKPYTTTKEQLRMLKERGLNIRDDEEVLDKLLKIGYYRLSSYWFTLEVKDKDGNRSHAFKTGATFDDVMRLYVFDQKVRLLVMEAMERIEICIRSVWEHKLSELYGSHSHLEKALLCSHF